MKKIFIILLFILLGSVIYFAYKEKNNSINRYKVVKRHNVYINKFDSLSSLTVGNGKFAFTIDPTGLQSFPDYYERGICLGTMSDWGWHSFPNLENFVIDETEKLCKCNNKNIPYSIQLKEPLRKAKAVDYFRKNPHRIHLGIIGFDFFDKNGQKLEKSIIKNINQKLDLWKGIIFSSYKINNKNIKVLTCVHSKHDVIGCKIISPLLNSKQIFIKIRLPYPTGNHTDSGCDWTKDSLHQSSIVKLTDNFAIIEHKLDDFKYFIKISWEKGKAKFIKNKNHFYYLIPEVNKEFIFTASFAENLNILIDNLSFDDIFNSSKKEWKKFWTKGGFIDFTGSKDNRAYELERRIILSRYLTKTQCTGLYPPQETGLTFNSWYGKFHLEMIWWHSVHFILWNQPEYVEKILDYYFLIEDKAEKLAKNQGYKGVRWPKMTSPEGINSPSSVGSYLIWQQPHFIYLAELLYRHYQNINIIKKYERLVYKTAEFMASYPWLDKKNNRYILGPCLIPAQECFPADSTINPAFELIYWQWGLKTANLWRERSGYKRNALWDSISDNLSKLIIKDSTYIFAESAPDSYLKHTHDHPIILGIYGMLPGKVDTNIMLNTFKKVIKTWQWDKTWGWDYPLAAMCAVRLGLPEVAIDLLLMNNQKNTYLINGHNYQDNRLRIYLPGNGGLLTAIAMMSAGYDGNKKLAPGFPKNNWKVKWENLHQIP